VINRLGTASFAVLLFSISLFNFPASAQSEKSGAVRPLSQVKFEGDAAKCLSSATENGNPDTGPSTLILKAAPGCKVSWHYHTAEEQLIVTAGTVQAEMDGMAAATLESGGFAMMPSKVKHRFSCESKNECIMFVTFDRKYDIVWLKPTPQSDVK
jgi:quercetin dioxygenase-like cupin family protein